MQLGRLYQFQQTPLKAKAVFEQGLTANPDSLQLTTALVILDFTEGRKGEALKRCQDLTARRPDDPAGHFLTGRVIARDDPAAAEKAFQKAIDLNPLWQPAHNALTALYLRQGQKDKAIQRLQAAIAADDRNIGAYLTLAQLHMEGQEFDRAMDVYRQVLDQYPNLWPALNNLAFLQSENSRDNEDLEMAREIAQKALAQQPQNPVVLDTLGWINYRLGNNGEALALLEQAVEKLSRDEAVVNYHLAAALHAAGRDAEARVLLEKALNSDEDFTGRQDAETLIQKMS
jgi:tetratricopeptide (TPR) repeat protein